MSPQPGHDEAPKPVDLAREADFVLGGMQVRPSLCEANVGGAQIHLQPRVMQVLTALARAHGEVMSRDDLILCCWGGMAVGDDALNRCIQQLRRLSEQVPQAFVLETVPRVGYRLRAAQSPAPPAATPMAIPAPGAAANVTPAVDIPLASSLRPSPSTPRVRFVVAAAAGVLILAGLTWDLWGGLHPARGDTVALKPFEVSGGAPAAKALASGVRDELTDTLDKADVKVLASDGQGYPPTTAFALDGRAELLGSDLQFTAALADARDHAVLWSAHFTRPPRESEAMREQVAIKLAAVLHCALDTSNYPGGRIEADTVKLYLRACDLAQLPDAADRVRDLYKQVLQRQPRFALAWARLAYATANAAFAMPSDQAEALRREARQDAQTALRLDPHMGLAYEALGDIGLFRLRFDQIEALFAKGLAVDPNSVSLLQDKGQLILRMGQTNDALALMRRAVALSPLSPAQQVDLADALVDNNRIGAAREILEQARRLWPDDRSVAQDLAALEIHYGDPVVGRAMLDGPNALLPDLSDSRRHELEALLAVRRSNRPEAIQALVKQLLADYRAGNVRLEQVMSDLSSVGALDAAFHIAATAPGPAPGMQSDVDPEFLWAPATERLRRDPRFVTLAAKLGVATYWRETGKWPDFCAAPGWPYDCKAEVAKPPPLDPQSGGETFS